MACGCLSKSNINFSKAMTVAGARPIAEPAHAVLPGESCIYCACKHLSVAYTTALASGDPALCIGELELARRHTLKEFPEVAGKAAEALLGYMVKGDGSTGLLAAVKLAADIADASSPDDNEDVSTGSFSLETPPQDPDVMNPYIGALHLYAAWRLASEIGYMIPNRAMIVGDLALAGEHLVRHDFGIETYLRNLRHRVQTRRSADLSGDWTATVHSTEELLAAHSEEFRLNYSGGFADYLNFPLRV